MTSPVDAASAGLPRRLGLVSALAIVIGTTIGSGIFRSPASIVARLPSPLPMMAVWVVGGGLALCGALTIAELASALPRTGGFYAFIREGWGDLAGFLFGWTELVIIRAVALGAVATTFAEYALRLRPGAPMFGTADNDVHYLAAAAIVLLATVNILGVRLGALVLELTVFAKYGALVFLVVITFALHFHAGGSAATAPATAVSVGGAAPGGITAGAFALALVSVLWAYDGWGDLSFVAGEVKEPARNLPRALIGGTVAVVAIYLAANLAYLAVVPIAEMPASKLIAADVAQRLVGQWGVLLVGVAVVLSTFGTLNGSLLTAPRIFYAMATDGLFFRQLGAVHERFHTPWIAILLNAALGVAFVLLRTFEQLADTFVTAIVPFYALGVAAVFTLRRRRDWAPAFRVPGYPVTPALFIVATLYLLGSSLIEPSSRWPTLAVMAVTLLGIPVYRLVFVR
jgi:APA family basic amino acid/polyamine antiporter